MMQETIEGHSWGHCSGPILVFSLYRCLQDSALWLMVASI